jgi:hypothetical protein
VYPIIALQTKHLIQEFEWSYFFHIYQKLNQNVDPLSIEALECCDGSFVVQEFYDGKETVQSLMLSSLVLMSPGDCTHVYSF